MMFFGALFAALAYYFGGPYLMYGVVIGALIGEIISLMIRRG